MPSEPRTQSSAVDPKDLKDSGRARAASAKDGVDVNAVLRRAYESAVDESIPDSMLDLLEKLN